MEETYLSQFVTPLYNIEGPHPQLGATGVWLSIGDERFLVTAAHAIDGGYVWFPMQKGHKKLTSRGVVTHTKEGRDADKVDLAFFHLSADDLLAVPQSRRYITMEMTEASPPRSNQILYEFTGYPYRSEKKKLKERLLVPRFTSLTLQAAAPEEIEKCGYAQFSHIVARFDRKKMLSEGKRYMAPLPQGMSGGAVWLRNHPTANERRFVGIGIECPNGYLAGVRISAVLETIRLFMPELAPSIPHPIDLAIDFVISKNGQEIGRLSTEPRSRS